MPFDAEAARIFGRVTAAVIAAGRKPRGGAVDLMIAATAIAEGLPLYTTNPADFTGLEASSASSRSPGRLSPTNTQLADPATYVIIVCMVDCGCIGIYACWPGEIATMSVMFPGVRIALSSLNAWWTVAALGYMPAGLGR